MKPITPRPHWWAICLLFLALVPAMISCNSNTKTEAETATSIPKKKTKKIKVKKNSGRDEIAVCLKANVDWNTIDHVVVTAMHTKGNLSITLTSTSDTNRFSYKEKKKHMLDLVAEFYAKDGKVIEGDWCEQNGTDCQIPASEKCSSNNAPIASVKSTVAAISGSVTVSVDER